MRGLVDRRPEKNTPKKSRVSHYFAQHYQWIIGVLLAVITILIGIITVPWGVSLESEAELAQERATLKSTATFYFTPTYSIETASVEDGAYCWTSSNSSTRTDAYRCTLGNNIHDPCFYQSMLNIVDCPPDPNNHKVLTVSKMEKNKQIKDVDKVQTPWFVLLENRQSCRFMTGATDVVADGRIDYGCTDGGNQWLSLPIENDNGVLNIRCFNPSLNRIEVCKLREAWY